MIRQQFKRVQDIMILAIVLMVIKRGMVRIVTVVEGLGGGWLGVLSAVIAVVHGRDAGNV